MGLFDWTNKKTGKSPVPERSNRSGNRGGQLVKNFYIPGVQTGPMPGPAYPERGGYENNSLEYVPPGDITTGSPHDVLNTWAMPSLDDDPTALPQAADPFAAPPEIDEFGLPTMQTESGPPPATLPDMLPEAPPVVPQDPLTAFRYPEEHTMLDEADFRTAPPPVYDPSLYLPDTVPVEGLRQDLETLQDEFPSAAQLDESPLPATLPTPSLLETMAPPSMPDDPFLDILPFTPDVPQVASVNDVSRIDEQVSLNDSLWNLPTEGISEAPSWDMLAFTPDSSPAPLPTMDMDALFSPDEPVTEPPLPMPFAESSPAEMAPMDFSLFSPDEEPMAETPMHSAPFSLDEPFEELPSMMPFAESSPTEMAPMDFSLFSPEEEPVAEVPSAMPFAEVSTEAPVSPAFSASETVEAPIGFPVQGTPELTGGDSEEDHLRIVASHPLAQPGHLIALVEASGIYSLMGSIGEEVFVIKLFYTPPFDPENVAMDITMEGQAAGKEMYLVKLGSWQAVICVDAHRIFLHTELT